MTSRKTKEIKRRGDMAFRKAAEAGHKHPVLNTLNDEWGKVEFLDEAPLPMPRKPLKPKS
jgi:hypothetical protein